MVDRLVTDIKLYMAPSGTVTVKLLMLAAVTVARVSPKKTALFAAVVLKLAPLIVTLLPIGPLPGEKEVIAGACPNEAQYELSASNSIIKYFPAR